MSLLSEITIKPGESKIYLRLVLLVYLLSIGLVMYSSLYLLIKFILIGVLAVLLKSDWLNKTPGDGVDEIKFIGNAWVLTLNNGKKQKYSTAQVLINNTLFQLIQFTEPNQKRSIVLFHDQVPNNQLRQLHLKMAQE